MNQELHQNVGSVLEKTVKSASGLTVASGVGTVLDIIPDILGCISMVIGLFVTIYFSIRKKNLYDQYERRLNKRATNRKEVLIDSVANGSTLERRLS